MSLQVGYEFTGPTAADAAANFWIAQCDGQINVLNPALSAARRPVYVRHFDTHAT